jgi:tetratricopeptide (TPR) repeat protein
VAIATSVACAALLGGLALATWQWRAAHLAWKRAEQNYTEAERQRARAESHLDHAESAIDQMLANVGDAFVGIPQLERLRQKCYADAIQLQKAILAEEPSDPASRLRMAQAYRRLSNMQQATVGASEALPTANLAMATIEAIPAGTVSREALDKEKGNIALALSQIRFRENDLLESERFAQMAIDSLRDVVELHPDRTTSTALAAAYRYLGKTQTDTGRLAEARISYENAVSVLNAVPSPDRNAIAVQVEYCQTQQSLGLLFVRLGQLDDAIERYRAVVEASGQLITGHRERVDLRLYRASALLNLGIAQGHANRHDQALAAKEQACDEYRMLSDSFPDAAHLLEDVVATLASKGRTLRDLHRLDDACQALRDAVETARRGLDRFPLSPELLEELTTAYASLGTAEMDRGAMQAAEQAFREGVTYGKQLLDLEHDTTDALHAYSRAIRALGHSLVNQGKHEGAVEILLSGLPQAEQALAAIPTSPANRGNVEWFYIDLCKAYCSLGRHDEAIDIVRKIPEIDPQSGDTYADAAAVLAQCIDMMHSSDGDQTAVTEAVQDRYRAEAITLLEQSVAIGGDSIMAGIRESKNYAPLASDPRFQQLTK